MAKSSKEFQDSLNEKIQENIAEKNSFASFVAKVKERAFKLHKVVITSNDKRDNDQTSAILLTCENQYFGLSKIIPLAIPVEVEECLLDTAKEIMIPVHVDEVKNGRRTGNSTQTLVRKYNISYED